MATDTLISGTAHGPPYPAAFRHPIGSIKDGSGWLKVIFIFYILSMPCVYMKMHAGCFNESLYRNAFIDCVYNLTVDMLHNNMNEILQTVLATVFNFKALSL